MDHLPAIRTVQGLETVPYVCKKSYDGGPFLTYPIRENKPQVIVDPANGAGKLPFWEYEKHHPTPNDELEAFCQTWLFFGLINELLGNTCEWADFVLPDKVSDCEIISTSRLPGLIEIWVKSIEDGFSTTTYEHVAACLNQVFDTLRAARPEFDPRIKFCIASVGELFEHAANKAFGIENFVLDNKCPAKWRTLFENTPWLERWRRSGWCPSQIEILLRSSISLQPLYFFASLQVPVSSGRHGLCGIQKCIAYQTDLKDYKTQHLIRECKCKELHMDMSRLVAVLSAGGLPLLRIRESKGLDDLSLEIVASEPDTHYVALSHVWADGLGNPKANSLPRCQLLHLSNLARSLRARLSLRNPPTELLLWCDTLCCPVNPQWAKNQVLAHMKDIYEQATCVLVLDASLQPYQSEGMGPEETCARILASGWMRRLWTLQEGALPAVRGRLWFQFCDQAVNLQPIKQQMNILLNDLSRGQLAIAILARIRTFTTFFDRTPNDLGADLGTVGAALQHRSVSVSSDEPLLIGTLLGLDVTAILNGSEKTRIHRMWSLMPSAVRGIPIDILFRLGPRLREEGYRWVPSSMLHYEDDNPVIRTMREGKNQGIPTQHGLLVRLCGYPISFPRVPKWLPTCPWGLSLDQNCFYMRDHRGCWYFLRRRWPSALGDYLTQEKFSGVMRSYTNLWVLGLKNRPDDFPVTGSTALVTRLSRETEDVKYVRSYMQIQVAELLKASCEMFEAAYRCAQKLTESARAKHLATMEKNGIHMESPEYKAAFDTLKPEIYRIAASSENGAAMATARDTSGKDHDILFGAIVGMIFSGHHGIMGPRTPDDQQWCVD